MPMEKRTLSTTSAPGHYQSDNGPSGGLTLARSDEPVSKSIGQRESKTDSSRNGCILHTRQLLGVRPWIP